jgi:hypothetical protein
VPTNGTFAASFAVRAVEKDIAVQNSNLENLDFGLVWGAKAIAAALNISERKCFHLLESGHLPARKIGGSWVVPRQAIARLFDSSAAA